MNAATDDLFLKAVEAANSLKTVQISFSDETEEKRCDYLAEEVDRVLEAILPDQRGDFLKVLAQQFPCWDAEVALAGRSASEPEEEPDTPEMLADRFIEKVQLLDDDEKRRVIKRLQSSGMVAPSSPAETRKKVQRDPGEAALPPHIEEAAQYLMHKTAIGKLDMTRAFKLLVRLVEQTGSSDELIWKTWRLIAPRSSRRRECDLKKEMARYLSGDREVSGMDMSGSLDKLRKLTACMIAGLGQAPGEFARSHLGKFSPQEIEAKVAAEGGSLLVSKEYKCWEQYVQLAQQLDEQNVEHAIREAIAQKTESLLQTSAR